MTDTNLDMRRGNTFSVRFDFEDAPGTPTDLSGSTIVFYAQTGDNSTSITKKTGTDAEITMATPTNGQVTLTLTPVQTRDFTAGLVNRYELEYWPAAGGQYTVLEGYLKVTEGINPDA